MKYIYLLLPLYLFSCRPANNSNQVAKTNSATELVVLGIAQDAGYPQIDCEKPCCQRVWNKERQPERVTCLGLIDRENKKSWLLEATPDLVSQWQSLKQLCPECEIEGIIITHAHIGHYTGLMYLGREALNAHDLSVYVMPKMADFLSKNGPWSQLLGLQNVAIKELKADSTTILSPALSLIPHLVPHRDEFSETVGFEIVGSNKTALFIPDIDKWSKWEQNLGELIARVDYAFLDATFYDGEELPGRNMAEIPHPFVVETMERLKALSTHDKSKIYCIHLNHTNPLLNLNEEKRIFVENSGFNVSADGLLLPL
ncbi:pyrroloquinoline quinone biosynthesis protein PqqB [bacterium]|nr:pyrroloquinoline quinone biosynthesis protein PqqB [bacterium]